jgi:hypothetical protein
MVFQSTIPRGAWLNYMKATGPTVAPRWYAAYSRPLRGVFREFPHAEDSVEFLCDRKMGGFDTGHYDECRIIVFGNKGYGGMIGQVNLCDKENEKNPTCQQVASMLGIKFLPNGVSARQMDDEEARGWRPAVTNHNTTMDDVNDRRGNSTTVNRLGGGGTGSGTNTAGSRGSQTRVSTTSQARSSASQAQMSNRTSASRTSATGLRK